MVTYNILNISYLEDDAFTSDLCKGESNGHSWIPPPPPPHKEPVDQSFDIFFGVSVSKLLNK